MQNLPSKRGLGAYRISRGRMPDGEYVYSITSFTEENMGHAMSDFNCYRFDVLPDWIQNAIATLDTAGSNVGVPGLGRKVGNAYWIGEGLDGELFGL